MKLFLLVFVSCIFVSEKFLAVRLSYESTNTLFVFIFFVNFGMNFITSCGKLIILQKCLDMFKLKLTVYLLIILFDNDGRISPFLEWLHSLAHRCSLWKHQCRIPSNPERSRRQLQSKGKELWKD